MSRRSQIVPLEHIRIALSAITNTVYAGCVNNDNKTWKIKKDVTSDFHKAVIEMFNGYTTVVKGSDGKKYKVIVEEIKETADRSTERVSDNNKEANAYTNAGGIPEVIRLKEPEKYLPKRTYEIMNNEFEVVGETGTRYEISLLDAYTMFVSKSDCVIIRY